MSSTFLLIGKIILEVSHSVIRAALCHPFHCSCYFVVPAFEFSSLTFWYRIAIPLKNCNNKLQHNLNYKNAKHHYFFDESANHDFCEVNCEVSGEATNSIGSPQESKYRLRHKCKMSIFHYICARKIGR